ncbi:MAG: MFS transporter [bacterium]|nr:MFS transporter [bacterium]
MFSKIKGNAKACLIFEAMWVVPFNMFATYASIYMLSLGLKETQIGLLTSINLVLQIFTSFISGHLTDRLGRRKALLIFDLVSWSIATLIWAIAQNFWYFLAAVIVNSFQKIPNTAWYCLLVEDTEPENRSAIFTILQVISVISGFFAPLGGLLVSKLTLVPAVRLMYLIACISMTVMFFGRNAITYDTEISIKKRLESKGINFKESLKEYKEVLKEIVTNRLLMIIVGVYILNNFQMAIRGTYLSIYLVNALGIKDSLIGLFPAFSSVAMLVLLLLVIPKFKEEFSNRYMVIGFGISMLANTMLILLPPKNITGVIVVTMLSASGSIIANPYLESTIANLISDENRAKMLAILTVLLLVFISPAGIIGGWTYSINPRIPFVLITLAFLLNEVLLLIFKQRKRQLT